MLTGQAALGETFMAPTCFYFSCCNHKFSLFHELLAEDPDAEYTKHQLKSLKYSCDVHKSFLKLIWCDQLGHFWRTDSAVGLNDKNIQITLGHMLVHRMFLLPSTNTHCLPKCFNKTSAKGLILALMEFANYFQMTWLETTDCSKYSVVTVFV